MNLDTTYFSWEAVVLNGAYRVKRMDDTLLQQRGWSSVGSVVAEPFLHRPSGEVRTKIPYCPTIFSIKSDGCMYRKD